MLPASQLAKVLPELPSRPLRHVYFRVTSARWQRDPLGRRRPILAQRFNVKDGARVLYLGDDAVTCLEEVQAMNYPQAAQAVVVFAVQIDLKAVVNLTLPAVQEVLHTNPAELAFNFRAVTGPTATQLLGEAASASGGIDGLLYESPARAGHMDLAVLEGALARLGSRITVEDPVRDTLP